MIIEVFGEYINPDHIVTLKENSNYTPKATIIRLVDGTDISIKQKRETVTLEINKQIKIAESTRRNWDDVVSDMAIKGQSMYYTPYPKDVPVETNNI